MQINKTSQASDKSVTVCRPFRDIHVATGAPLSMPCADIPSQHIHQHRQHHEHRIYAQRNIERPVLGYCYIKIFVMHYQGICSPHIYKK